MNVMHVLIELGIFRGHVLMGSYGLKPCCACAVEETSGLESSPDLCRGERCGC